MYRLPLETNPILKSDAYKFSHKRQIRPGATRMTSYVTARKRKEGLDNYVVVSGVNRWVHEILSKPFNQDHIDDAELFCTFMNIPFEREDFEHILTEHQGYFPVIVEALPEGTIVGINELIMKVTNTDYQLPWIESWLETTGLRYVWTTSTVATISSNIYTELYKFAEKSSDNDINRVLSHKLYDFGSRGCSDPKVGAGHLIMFQGSDNIEAIASVVDTFKSDTFPASSIPAAEHSTITIMERYGEQAAYENLISEYLEKGTAKIIAAPIDSYDMYNAIDNILGKNLKERIISSGGIFIQRLDSGDPVEVVLDALEMNAKNFGYTTNAKGYKVLHDAVRLFQGDGIDKAMIMKIISAMDAAKYSIDNITLGMGGALLQHMDRDWMSWAMKCNAIEVDEKWIDVYKDPITDPGKRSRAGLLDVIECTDGTLETVNWISDRSALITLYDTGTWNIEDLDDIRARYLEQFNSKLK